MARSPRRQAGERAGCPGGNNFLHIADPQMWDRCCNCIRFYIKTDTRIVAFHDILDRFVALFVFKYFSRFIYKSTVSFIIINGPLLYKRFYL